MLKKTYSAKVRILEILALTGEMTADNIKTFFPGNEYARKTIINLKKESLIKIAYDEGKPIYRLTLKGKDKLKEVSPEVFTPLLEGGKTMNKTRNDKRRKERRNKLIEILLLFQRADVKIFPDEKVLLKNSFVMHGADITDNTDFVKIVNIVTKDGSAEQEKLYRWFEIPFDCTKEELLEKINDL